MCGRSWAYWRCVVSWIRLEPPGRLEWFAIEARAIEVAHEDRHAFGFIGVAIFEPGHRLGHAREVAIDRLRGSRIDKKDMVRVLAAGVGPPFILATQHLLAEQLARAIRPRQEERLRQRQGDRLAVLGFEEIDGLQAARLHHPLDLDLAQRDRILLAAVGGAIRGEADKLRIARQQQRIARES